MGKKRINLNCEKCGVKEKISLVFVWLGGKRGER